MSCRTLHGSPPPCVACAAVRPQRSRHITAGKRRLVDAQKRNDAVKTCESVPKSASRPIGGSNRPVRSIVLEVHAALQSVPIMLPAAGPGSG